MSLFLLLTSGANVFIAVVYAIFHFSKSGNLLNIAKVVSYFVLGLTILITVAFGIVTIILKDDKQFSFKFFGICTLLGIVQAILMPIYVFCTNTAAYVYLPIVQLIRDLDFAVPNL